jgi:hypothetical protein
VLGTTAVSESISGLGVNTGLVGGNEDIVPGCVAFACKLGRGGIAGRGCCGIDGNGGMTLGTAGTDTGAPITGWFILSAGFIVYSIRLSLINVSYPTVN